MRQRKLGSDAEHHVAGILLGQGWTIVARNYRWIGTEIDILASKGSSLIAVEVKFRTCFPSNMTQLEQLIPRRKLDALTRGLQAAVRHFRQNQSTTRIDLVIVSPVAQNRQKKLPPGTGSGGNCEQPQPFRVAWYPGIGS